MIQPKCRLTLASKYYGGLFGGGGGGGGATQISPSKEYSKIIDLFGQKTLPAYQGFAAGNPNIQAMQNIAGQMYGQLPGLEKQLGAGLTAEQQNIPWAQNLIRSQYGTATPTGQLTSPLMATYRNQLQPILASGGALTPQQTRLATQQAAAQAGLAGMANTNPALFAGALNRDVYRQQRYNTALQQSLGLTGDVSNLDTAGLARAQGAAQGVTGYDQQRQQNLMNYISGLTGIQGTTQQGLGNALNTGIGAFTQLLNPSSNIVSSATNYNANAQNAANIANQNNKNSTTGALIGAGAKVASAYA